MEGLPGFGHALGISLIQEEQLQWLQGKNTLKVRMPLTKSLLWTNQGEKDQQKTAAHGTNVGLLSTFAAIIDETTTFALVAADPKSGRPGVSVHLSMEAGPALHGLSVGDEIEISSHVQKTGRNLGFTKAYIRLVPSGELICCGSHTKFLNNFGVLGNVLLSSYGWPILKAYCDLVLKDSRDSKVQESTTKTSLSEMFASLKSDGKTSAIFQASPAHSSMGGPIHGGAQAIILERAAESVLPQNIDADNFKMDSIQIEYISAPNFHPEVKLTPLPSDDVSRLVISAELWSRGKLNSASLLRYSKNGVTSSTK